MNEKSQGSALISALLIATLAATVATTVHYALYQRIQQTTLILNQDIGQAYTEGVILWAVQLITDPAQKAAQKANYDFPSNDFYGVRISGQLIDEQAKFNINRLAASEKKLGFIQFATRVLPELDADTVTSLAANIHLWFQQQNSPRYLQIFNELLQLDSKYRKTLLALKPYLTALPPDTPMNVNTAGADLLMTLDPKLNAGLARLIIETRTQQPFAQVADLAKIPAIAALNLNLQSLTVTSEYYTIAATAYFPSGQRIQQYIRLQVTAAGVVRLWKRYSR